MEDPKNGAALSEEGAGAGGLTKRGYYCRVVIAITPLTFCDPYFMFASDTRYNLIVEIFPAGMLESVLIGPNS